MFYLTIGLSKRPDGGFGDKICSICVLYVLPNISDIGFPLMSLFLKSVSSSANFELESFISSYFLSTIEGKNYSLIWFISGDKSLSNSYLIFVSSDKGSSA